MLIFCIQISAITGELHQLLAANTSAEVRLFFVMCANVAALEFDEMLPIPTCDNALPTRSLCGDAAEATDFLQVVYTFEQRLLPRILAQAAELQQMVRVSLLLYELIFNKLHV